MFLLLLAAYFGRLSEKSQSSIEIDKIPNKSFQQSANAREKAAAKADYNESGSRLFVSGLRGAAV